MRAALADTVRALSSEARGGCSFTIMLSMCQN
jgi:hypothetical protein